MSRKATRIYTRTGDRGETGLPGGRRVRKDCPEIQALGDVDELNSVIGMILAHDLPADIRDSLTEIQHRLFDLGAELGNPRLKRVHPEMITRLEARIDTFTEGLPALKSFILGLPPGPRCLQAGGKERGDVEPAPVRQSGYPGLPEQAV